MTCVRHAAAERLADKLADGFDNTEMPTGRAGLANGQLPARGIAWKTAAGFERVGADERGPCPLGAETETLELQNVDDRIVVINFDEIHVVGADASLLIKCVAVHGPTTAILHRIVGKGVVPFDGA